MCRQPFTLLSFSIGFSFLLDEISTKNLGLKEVKKQLTFGKNLQSVLRLASILP